MDQIPNKAGSYWFIQKANKKINSFGDDIDQYHASENVPGTSVKYVMDMVLVAQYFDTTKEIGASLKSSSVLIPHRPSADIAMQIRDGLLQVDSAHISEA